MPPAVRTSSRLSFLPAPVQDLLFRTSFRLLGLILLAAGAALLLALASHDPRDPSWNTSAPAGAGTGNLLGMAGSWSADFLLQTLGLPALVPALVLIGWGWRILTGRPLTAMPWRICAMLVSLVLLSAALSPLPALPDWIPGHSLPGGLLGHLIADVSGFPGSPRLAVSALLLVAVSLLAFAAGYSRQEWMTGLRALGRLVQSLAVWLAWAVLLLRCPAGRMVQWVLSTVRSLRRGEDAHDTYGSDPGLMTGSNIPVFLKTPFPDEEEDGDDLPEEPAPRASRKGKSTRKQSAMALLAPGEDDPFQLPPPELLQTPVAIRNEVSQETLRQNAKLLESVLGDFGVKGQIVKVHPGPVVTLYELEPAPGVKSSRVIGLADDIARSMSAVSVRVAVVPGRNVIGIELPNVKRETVYLRELLASEAYENASSRLPLVLGKDIGGGPVVADLARMPHLLVAGTTGSGKSVAINTMILSLLYRLPPEKCRFIMVDPKMLELSVYEGIPHLLAPVVTEPKKAVVALKWAVREMEDRYRAMSRLGVRNIEGYNARLKEARQNGETLTRRVQTGFDPDTGKPIMEEQPLDLTELPYIVVIVDEMADLMLVAGKDIESAIQRLAQMARAAGIHIIMATQRPSVDVITGTIKANFPTRISFQVTSKIDSRTILGEQGAEQLLGQGDMLHMAGGGRITRVHGPFVSDGEVEAVVKFLRAQGEPSYVDAVTEDDETEGGEGGDMPDGAAGGGSGDELYDQAVALVCREGKASTSFIQRHLRIGYNSAARLIEQMEKEGVVSAANHAGKREVLARREEDVM
ncbi:MAG: DNA translocase FtsK 4TM domain-containing protein [Pseudomonadota bacterium]|nr:DNA translocase FtsK 4TM domain-containing protein [Pseudomonadota bacterium]